MHLFIIRHGHRADEEEGYEGGGNPPLSSRGVEQARHMADFMADQSLTALYSSSMLRALQTAEPLHKKLGGPWHVWPVFCETPTILWQNLYKRNPEVAARSVAWRTDEEPERFTADEAEALEGNYYLLSQLPDRYPGVEISQPFPWPDAWWTALQGGCRETGFARLELGLAALLARHGGEDRVALVAHGNSGDMMLAILLALPRTQGRRVGTAHASIACVEIYDQNTRRLVYLNREDHLPDHLRS